MLTLVTAFLMGLLAATATIIVIKVAVMSGKWLMGYVIKKLKNYKNHKVAFADTREVVDDYIKSRAYNSEEISMEELERMCEEKPYTAAVIDEQGDIIGEYEGFMADSCNENFKAHMKQQEGMIIVGV